jgi:phospholipid/cholesterol/gamma-HCH transport system permease protein
MIRFFILFYKKIYDPFIERVILFLNTLGKYLYFLKDLFGKIIAFSPNYGELFSQIYYIGAKSIFVVSITGVFVGALVSMNLQMQLQAFGANKFIGGLNVSSSFRELTPLLISFIIASKVGVFTTAELGAMRISDEIDTLRSLAVDPVRYLIVPRFIGVFVSSFFLLILGLFMSFVGGMAAAVSLGVNPVQYVITIPILVSTYSLMYAIVKCLIFGFLVASIGCFMGYYARGGSEGLARVTRLTAEVLIVALIFFDYLLVMLMNFISGML